MLHESMSKGDMNLVMYSLRVALSVKSDKTDGATRRLVIYGILKMVEYKIQVITFSQIFHDFYTCLLGQLCKILKSFNGQRYRCGIYCTFEDHILVHLCCNKKS